MRQRQIYLIASVVLSSFVTTHAIADDWPQYMGPARDSVWRETGVLTGLPAHGPTVLWRAAVSAGYSGPAVAGGRVFVADFEADTKGENNPGRRAKISGVERLHALEAATGKTLWTYSHPTTYDLSYPGGPRCTPTVAGEKVYTLGAMGHLACLEAATGKPLWTCDLPSQYKAEVPIWGFCGHPLVDGDRLFVAVGGPGSVVVALDRHTGAELWKALSAREVGYGVPTMIEVAGVRQLVYWHAEAINGLDPVTGKVLWSVRLAPSYGMSIAAPRLAGDKLFAGGIVNVSALIGLAGDAATATATVLWTGDAKTSLGPVNMTPFIDGQTLYGVDREGQLRAVRLADGTRLWETYAATTGKLGRANSGTAFLVQHAPTGKFFLFNETGELIVADLSPRGYSEVSRAQLIQPTNEAFGRPVVWSHPAFANRCVYVRNDREVVCVSLAANP